MRKFVQKGCTLFLTLMMVFSVTTANVVASEAEPLEYIPPYDVSVVSEDALRTIVADVIQNKDFGNSKVVDFIINLAKDLAPELISGMINELLTAEAIGAIVKPILIEVVQSVLGESALPAGIDLEKLVNDLVDMIIRPEIIESEFVSEIIERISAYTLEALLNDFDFTEIPELTVEEQAALTEIFTQDLYYNSPMLHLVSGDNNSPLVKSNSASAITIYTPDVKLNNTLYDVTIKWSGIYPKYHQSSTVKGWHYGNIKAYIDSCFVGVLCRVPEVANTIVKLPSEDDILVYLMDSAKRAATEVITERVEEIKASLNVYVQEMINQTLQALQTRIDSLKNAVVLFVDEINAFISSIKGVFPNQNEGFLLLDESQTLKQQVEIVAEVANQLNDEDYQRLLQLLQTLKTKEVIREHKDAILFIDIVIFVLELKHEDGKLESMIQNAKDYVYRELNAVLGQIHEELVINVTDTAAQISAKLNAAANTMTNEEKDHVIQHLEEIKASSYVAPYGVAVRFVDWVIAHFKYEVEEDVVNETITVNFKNAVDYQGGSSLPKVELTTLPTVQNEALTLTSIVSVDGVEMTLQAFIQASYGYFDEFGGEQLTVDTEKVGTHYVYPTKEDVTFNYNGVVVTVDYNLSQPATLTTRAAVNMKTSTANVVQQDRTSVVLKGIKAYEAILNSNQVYSEAQQVALEDLALLESELLRGVVSDETYDSIVNSMYATMSNLIGRDVFTFKAMRLGLVNTANGNTKVTTAEGELMNVYIPVPTDEAGNSYLVLDENQNIISGKVIVVHYPEQYTTITDLQNALDYDVENYEWFSTSQEDQLNGAKPLTLTPEGLLTFEVDNFSPFTVGAQGAFNTAALQALMDEIALLVEQEYTEPTWADVQTALTNAHHVLINATTQKEIDDAYTTLGTAKDNLVKRSAVLDTTALQALMNQAQALRADDYKANTWSVLVAAMQQAQTVLDTAKHQKEIDEAYETLEAAIQQLVLDRNGWRLEQGIWYYYTHNVKQTGWIKLGNIWYHLDSTTGAMATGWRYINGTWYYFLGNGHMLTGWQFINGTWYYLQTSGAMASGWLQLGNIWYYLDTPASGAMATGWKIINGRWYYFLDNGHMMNGWQQVDGTWYYLNYTGELKTGWYYESGNWYYLQFNGAMSLGWNYVNGTWYYFYANGKMAVNTEIDGWIINASGAARKK